MTPSQLKLLLSQWVDLLTPSQLSVISFTYGLNTSRETLNDVEIAEKLDIGKTTVADHRKAAFNHLNSPKFKPLKDYLKDDTTT